MNDDEEIVIALAAISAPHYLGPIWGGFTHGWVEIAVTAAGANALMELMDGSAGLWPDDRALRPRAELRRVRRTNRPP